MSQTPDSEKRGTVLSALAFFGDRRALVMRTTAIEIVGVVIGANAGLLTRVRGANGRNAGRHRNAVGPWKRSEVRIEGAVLLHDDDHVPDLVNAGERRRAGREQEREHDRRRRNQPLHPATFSCVCEKRVRNAQLSVVT